MKFTEINWICFCNRFCDRINRKFTWKR